MLLKVFDMPLTFPLKRCVCRNFVFGCNSPAKFLAGSSAPGLVVFKRIGGTSLVFWILQNTGIEGCTRVFVRHLTRNWLFVLLFTCCFSDPSELLLLSVRDHTLASFETQKLFQQTKFLREAADFQFILELMVRMAPFFRTIRLILIFFEVHQIEQVLVIFCFHRRFRPFFWELKALQEFCTF